MQPVMAHRLVHAQGEACPPPWELMICPTHRCNLKCAICARSYEEQQHPVLSNELPDARWLQLVDEAAALGVRYLSIGGGGEPTLRRELVMAICAKAKQLGLEGHLQTNGTVLRQEDVTALVDMGWDHVTISLDGPVAVINDAIRFKNAFNESLKRIDMLRAEKSQRRAAKPDIQVHMVITALNFDQLEAMVKLCIAHGVEALFATPLLEYSPDMTQFRLSDEQRAALPGHAARAIAQADAARLTHNLTNLLSLSSSQGNVAASLSAAPHHWPPGHIAGVRCLEPWRGLVVSASGHALPCCYFWEEKADSIRNLPLQEVWMGTYLTSFREQMRAGALPDCCCACGYPDSAAHRQLMHCVQQAALSSMDEKPLWRNFAAKAWKSVRKHGAAGSLKRFRQWRAIRKALKNES